MRDRKWVLSGLGVFCALVLFPVLYGATVGRGATPPEPELPADETACVEATDYMRANHPTLLNAWRDAVVREGRTTYTSAAGATYTMSLTGTCMGCHDNRETFCTSCHDYADVTPTCWDCHVEPPGE